MKRPEAIVSISQDPRVILSELKQDILRDKSERIRWAYVKPESFTDVRPVDFAADLGWTFIKKDSTRHAAANFIRKHKRVRRSIEDIEILFCAQLEECLADFAHPEKFGMNPTGDEDSRMFRLAVYPFLRELRESIAPTVGQFWAEWKAKAETCRFSKRAGATPSKEEQKAAQEAGTNALHAARLFFSGLFQSLHPLRVTRDDLVLNLHRIRSRYWFQILRSPPHSPAPSRKQETTLKSLESSANDILKTFRRLCADDQPTPSILKEIDKLMTRLTELFQRRKQLVSESDARSGRKRKLTVCHSSFESERTDRMVAKIQECYQSFLNDPGTRTGHVLPTFEHPDIGEVDWWRESRYNYLNYTSPATDTHTRRVVEQPVSPSTAVRDDLAVKVESLQTGLAAIDATTRDTNKRVRYLESAKRNANAARSDSAKVAARERGPNPDMAAAIRKVRERVVGLHEKATTACEWVCRHWKRTGSERNPIWESLQSVRGGAMATSTLYKAYITKYPVRKEKKK